MKTHRFLAGLVPAALLLGGLTLAGPAAAATTPAWEPDPNSHGTLSFYDATGKQVTGGKDLNHLFDYAAAETATTRGTTKAALYFAIPKKSQPDTSDWFSVNRSASTSFPKSTYPAPLNGFGSRPVGFAGPSDANLQALLGSFDNDTNAGYANTIQVRLYDTGPGIPPETAFWASDIAYDPAAGTWTQTFPTTAATQASLSLSASPASPQPTGTQVTFTAAVSPSGAAGTVQFRDGSTALGSPVAVSGGSAAYTTSALAQGTHSVTAEFVPADANAYLGATSTAIGYTVVAAPGAPTGVTATAGNASATVVWTAPTSDGGSAVTGYDVQHSADGGATWVDDTAVSRTGTSTTAVVSGLSNGTAYAFRVRAVNAAGAGDWSTASTAVTPADTAPATTTTTTLAVSPAGPRLPGTSVSLTATVSPAGAAGTVQFADGGTALGAPVAVSGGNATYTTTALAVGTHSITAQFVPTDPAVLTSSSSAAQTYVIANRPDAPTGVTAAAGNRSVTVSWTAAADGGSPVTGYQVQSSTDGTTWTDAASTTGATSVVVTGLSNGTAYRFRVHARNALGDGADSAASTAVSPVADGATVTIGSLAPAAKYGSVVTLGAVVANAKTKAKLAGQPVTLYRRLLPGAAFAAVARATTSSAGAVSARITLTGNAQFQWRYAGSAIVAAASSAVKGVTVSRLVTAAVAPASVVHGSRGVVRVYGTISAPVAKQKVTVQQLVGSAWRSVGTPTVTRQKLPNGRTTVGFALARTLTKAGTYRYRVLVAATSTLAAGVSTTLTARAR